MTEDEKYYERSVYSNEEDVQEKEINVFVLDPNYNTDRHPTELEDEQFMANAARFTLKEFEEAFNGVDYINSINSETDYIRFIKVPKGME